MARTESGFSEGTRLTDYIRLGVVAKEFPLKKVQSILDATGKAGIRQHDLPAQVMMYYVIAMALYMPLKPLFYLI